MESNDRNRVLQFEVWNECNNGCTFCSNKFVYNISDEDKLKNLDIIYEKLKEESVYEKYNIVGFIGGEFFMGQLKNPIVKQKFMDVVKFISEKIDRGFLKEFWITATLTLGDHVDMYEMLDLFKDKSKIWICTSYDSKGRFHNDKMKESWSFNMKELKRRFPNININVTTILTGDFIEEYIKGNFSVKKFTQEYDCTWFNKPPMIPTECNISKEKFNKKLPMFFPTRKRFLQFLMKFKSNETELEYDKLFNTELRADALIKTDYHDESNRMMIERNKDTDEEVTVTLKDTDFINDRDKILSINNDTNGKCKHNKAYTPYVDSEECFYCDKIMIKEMI